MATIVGIVVGHRIKKEIEKLPDGGGTVEHKFLAIELELNPLTLADTHKPSKAVIHVAVEAMDEYPLEAPVRLPIELPQQRLDLSKSRGVASKH